MLALLCTCACTHMLRTIIRCFPVSSFALYVFSTQRRFAYDTLGHRRHTGPQMHTTNLAGFLQQINQVIQSGARLQVTHFWSQSAGAAHVWWCRHLWQAGIEVPPVPNTISPTSPPEIMLYLAIWLSTVDTWCVWSIRVKCIKCMRRCASRKKSLQAKNLIPILIDNTCK